MLSKKINNESFNLMLITNDPLVANYASSCGVGRIFIDLEINGKYERQGHLNTVISKHSISDIYPVKEVLFPGSELLVRINPFYSETEAEIEAVINAGADIIMLPMFRTLDEVEAVSSLIRKRVKFIPLVETLDAANILSDIVNLKGVSEIYFGLNDLHREMKLSFMFEPLQNGALESLCSIARNLKVPFGFGGIAKIGEGILSSDLILSEHVRLGSSSVILSRSFHQDSKTIEELKSRVDLKKEVDNIYFSISENKRRSQEKILMDKDNLDYCILKVIGSFNEKII